MTQLNNPLVLRVFGLCYFQNEVGIVMERADYSLQYPTPLTLESLDFALQLVSAVKYLHARSVLHHDIKPANLLVCNGKLKVSDFGTARTISNNTVKNVSVTYTPKYAAPEVLDNKASMHSDVYNIGMKLCATKLLLKGCLLIKFYVRN
ncbi:hypothetical protein RCL1_002634 [Eukaryota sp. TZLM3-RCL]